MGVIPEKFNSGPIWSRIKLRHMFASICGMIEEKSQIIYMGGIE